MNKEVNFEIAKLLKEKGFDEPVYPYYISTGELIELCEDEPRRVKNSEMQVGVSAPTIAEVVMWLYEKHGLWVNVVYMGFELKYTWSIDIITTSGSNWDSYGEEDDICYNSPTEAYEAAIEYWLIRE